MLCALPFAAACARETVEPAQEASVLTIGYPEGTVAAADAGLRATIDLLTVEPLITAEADGRATPRLAESWSWENDGRQLRVRLRPGVTFHDGTPLEADVVAGLLRDIVASPGSQGAYPSVADVTEIRAEGELDVVLELSRRSAFLPSDLSFPLRSPEGNVGTGPFQVAERTPLQATLERFDAYYQGTSQVDRVEIQAFDSLRPAWASLLRGELDMVYDVPPEAIDFLQSEDIRILRFARSYQYLIVFNSSRAPFRSSLVRRAFNVAVDRGALVENVLLGRGEPSTGPIRPRFWAYDSSIAPYAFDPQLAEELLDEAGLRPGDARDSDNEAARVRFTVLVPEGFSILERLALEVQRYVYDIGVDMQIEVASVNDYNIRARDGAFEAVMLDATSGPTLSRSYIFWHSTSAFNSFGYENAEADEVFETLGTSIDNDGAVRTATRRLQQLFLDDPPALFLAWNERSRAVRQTFDVVTQADRDPILDLWRWRPVPQP